MDEQSVNTLEVAEPVETISENTQETAEPVTDKAEQTAETNRAFAEMRRNAQDAEKRALEAEKKLAEFTKKQEQTSQRDNALKEAERIARENGLTDQEIEELKAEMLDDMDKEEKYKSLQTEKEEVEGELAKLKAEKMAEDDLATLKTIDPNIKSLEELGENFFKLRFAKGDNGEFLLTPEQAYYAAQAYENKLESQQPKAPAETGFGGENTPSKSFYTREEVDAMSSAEIRDKLDAINESMKRWN